MTNTAQEDAQFIAWWLDPANQQIRKELAQHKPELESWLSMVERKVQEKLSEHEAQGVAAKA